MSIQSYPGKTPAPAGFRRRVILELTVEELPLLDAARERHGTIRQAVLEALRAAQEIEELQAKLASAQAQAGSAAKAKDGRDARAKRELEHERKAAEKLKGELRQAQQALDADQSGGRRATQLERELTALESAVGERDDELELLRERAVDHLYCARCDQLIAPEEWSWRATEDGSLAYHESCGDHGPGILGASSWLAHRSD
jgi:hypothetical protein